MNRPVPLRNKYQRQRGVTAIEFAILFPVFFGILYGIIQYGMIFAAQQTLTLAAEEGARAALQYQNYSDPGTALSHRATAAQTACEGMLSWLHTISGTTASGTPFCSASPSGPSVSSGTTTTFNCPTNASNSSNPMDCVQVITNYPYGSAPQYQLVPTLALLKWALPNNLGNSAIVQIDPANIL